jgi:hypothetical protein
MLRKHGGDYLDTKIPQIPAPRTNMSPSKLNSPDFTKTGLSKVESDMNGDNDATVDGITKRQNSSL